MHWIDPDGLPEVSGTVDRFLLNPHGCPDGLLLTDGTEIHFPPHLGAAVVAVAPPGRRVGVQGVRPRAAPNMVSAIAITASDGTRIVDHGPPADAEGRKSKPHGESHRRRMIVEGVVRAPIHGPKGETRGVLLEDGRILRFRPEGWPQGAEWLGPGRPIAAEGDGISTALGVVIEAQAIGPTKDDLRPTGSKTPKPHAKAGHHPPHAA